MARGGGLGGAAVSSGQQPGCPRLQALRAYGAFIPLTGPGATIGMVVDLTNSQGGYYHPHFFAAHTRYVKVRGGCAPEGPTQSSPRPCWHGAAAHPRLPGTQRSRAAAPPPTHTPSPPQVPCRGKGKVPEPAAVNMAVWEMRMFMHAFPTHHILIHCTHGFNRTGARGCCSRLAAAGQCGLPGLPCSGWPVRAARSPMQQAATGGNTSGPAQA